MGKIPWRRAWPPTPAFLSGESHGQRSLVGYSPWGCKELDTAEHACTAKGGGSPAVGGTSWLLGKERGLLDQPVRQGLGNPQMELEDRGGLFGSPLPALYTLHSWLLHYFRWFHCLRVLCVCSVTQSCLTLCDPMDCTLPGSSVCGILQTRMLEWVAISSSRGSS